MRIEVRAEIRTGCSRASSGIAKHKAHDCALGDTDRREHLPVFVEFAVCVDDAHSIDACEAQLGCDRCLEMSNSVVGAADSQIDVDILSEWPGE